MYLHLGEDVAVPDRGVIGVFDLETSTTAKDTRDYLDAAQRRGAVRDVCDDIPKAFVVVREMRSQREEGRGKNERDGDTVYITQVAASTIKKRTV